jgi:hypothetical protein
MMFVPQAQVLPLQRARQALPEPALHRRRAALGHFRALLVIRARAAFGALHLALRGCPASRATPQALEI